jgi:hypothetical protein
MTDTISVTTCAFISYAHQDAIIAEEIERQLNVLAKEGKGRSFLKCFLDTKSIPVAQKFQPIIKLALEQADWLIAVFTDHQSVYCGYEIGIYSVVKPHDDTPLDMKPVVCLHDVNRSKIPGVVEGYNTIRTERSRAQNAWLCPDRCGKSCWSTPPPTLVALARP